MKETPITETANNDSKEETTPANEEHEESIAEANANKTPTTKEHITEQCLKLILNTKHRNDIEKDVTKRAAEALSLFFKKNNFKEQDDGNYWIDEDAIFPTIARKDINKEQEAMLDRIVDNLEPIWNSRLKIVTKINKKSKRTRDSDSSIVSPPHKNVKSGE